MKIAVLVSGVLRSFKDTFENHQRMLYSRLPGEVHLFVDTWDFSDMSKDDPIVIEEIEALYQPKVLVVEKFQPFDLSFMDGRISCGWPQNSYCMFYKMHKGFENFENYCRQEKVRYDVVVRMRSDAFFKSVGGFSELLRTGLEEKIYVPSEGLWDGDVSDQFFLGKPGLMKLALGSFPLIKEKYIKEIRMHPETMITHHWNSIGLRREVIHQPLTLVKDGIILDPRMKIEDFKYE